MKHTNLLNIITPLRNYIFSFLQPIEVLYMTYLSKRFRNAEIYNIKFLKIFYYLFLIKNDKDQEEYLNMYKENNLIPIIVKSFSEEIPIITIAEAFSYYFNYLKITTSKNEIRINICNHQEILYLNHITPLMNKEQYVYFIDNDNSNFTFPNSLNYNNIKYVEINTELGDMDKLYVGQYYDFLLNNNIELYFTYIGYYLEGCMPVQMYQYFKRYCNHITSLNLGYIDNMAKESLCNLILFNSSSLKKIKVDDDFKCNTEEPIKYCENLRSLTMINNVLKFNDTNIGTISSLEKLKVPNYIDFNEMKYLSMLRNISSLSIGLDNTSINDLILYINNSPKLNKLEVFNNI